MKEKGRVALATPDRERRTRAASWVGLLADRAEIEVCESPGDQGVRNADLVLVDEQCPGLDAWIAEALAHTPRPDSILVFGNDGDSTRGALPWGEDGTPVLAALAELLERRAMLEDSEEFAGLLRESNRRLDEERRRFATLVLAHAKTMRETNVSLAREVEHLRRQQALARFFAAPGPADSFGERFACVVGQALGASGAALVRRDGEEGAIEGLWRISSRNARTQVPRRAEEWARPSRTSSSRKKTRGMWLPFGERVPDWGMVALFPANAPATLGDDARATLALAADGLAARMAAEARAERQLENDRALRSLRGGLLKIDARGRVALANPALAALLGIPASSITGRPIEELFARDPHLVEIFETIRTLPSHDEIETYLTSATGTAIPVSIRASLVREGDEDAAILALVFDLSRRKEVEAEMRRAERLASLGRLSAGVAHEIRNPLAGIRTTTELLRSRFSPEDDRLRFVDVILEESRRLDRIVSSLLSFAKPADPQPEPVDMGDLLDRAIELARGKAADLRVLLRKASGESVTCLADRDQILQVLLNLIWNAIEATPPGREVRAGVEPLAPKAATLHVRIEDGGEGVPPALRERIFDPFFTTKTGGTGLGLSISEHIVRRHGGSIRFEKPTGEPHAAVMALPVRTGLAAFRGGGAWPAS